MSDLNIESVDKNLAVSSKIDAPDVELHDVRTPPFRSTVSIIL